MEIEPSASVRRLSKCSALAVAPFLSRRRLLLVVLVRSFTVLSLAVSWTSSPTHFSLAPFLFTLPWSSYPLLPTGPYHGALGLPVLALSPRLPLSFTFFFSAHPAPTTFSLFLAYALHWRPVLTK
ncbi:hypothetical protein P171DRAFT_435037 [Karstenula rhodostoma CBS 690.94]|uniref:Transmembrane protein n=1 Tax=Karstenula rhodostoma CBS 690.94 TaxID=1392251 RepID=A0A9P4PE43_9PLEO|nr:hypothetical protein P171DRAFT_435037 [Karstenula rhodostoma CBS 690.94]